VTGWQPGDGGWNQNQAFGPDAQTNAYGSDPYANQGADPYGYGSQYGNDPTPYGADPYAAQYPQQPYPQQQYPPTGGFPAPGYGPPPPPPKRSKMPMVLSLIAIVIIVGAVVTIVLVNRQGDQPVVQNDPGSSSTPPPSKGESTTPSKGGSDWIAIDNTRNAGLTYEVPPDWKTTDTTYDSGLGVKFTGGAEYGRYECEGKPYIRTYLASGDVQGGESTDLELPKTLKDFATSFAKSGYGEDAQIEVPEPTETEVDGKPAMTLTAKVKQNVTSPNCQAVDAEVALIGVQVQAEGQPKGVAMLVVVNDLSGGPADPKALDAELTQKILSTVKLGS
jgi:hypothetical protein